MQEHSPHNKNVIFSLIFLFAALANGLIFVLDHKKSSNQEHHLLLISEQYQLAYNTIFHQYEQLALNLQSGFMARFNIQAVYQELLTADEGRKTQLRQELLAQTRGRFQEMQEEGMVQSIHFHLPNNESFLRLHQPDFFGDDLTGIRQTVEYVNREHQAMSGFENGKMYGGYRFVIPITGEDQTHLGSMEISFGPEAITSYLMRHYGVFSNFFIHKESANSKVISQKTQRPYSESHQKGYFYNEKVLAELEKVTKKNIAQLKPQKKITDEIFANAHHEQTMSIYDPVTDSVYTTIPVFNPFNHEMIAFCTVRSQSPFFKVEARHFKIVLSVSLLLLAMILLTYYLQFHQRKTLETHFGLLEIKQAELLNIQTVLQQERDMFMQGPVMIFTWLNTENFPITQVSPNVFEILGYSASEFLDGSVKYMDLVHPDDQKRIENDIKVFSVAEVDRFSHEPYRLINRAGSTVWVFDSTTFVRNPKGEIVEYLGYLVDITKMVLMENEIIETKNLLKTSREEAHLKRQDSLKTMAGAIAHRFNNSMLSVEGNLELLMKRLNRDSESFKMASDASMAAKGASKVGTMMLSYVGQTPLQLQKVSLFDLAEQSLRNLKHQLNPGVTLNNSQPGQPLFCSCDKLQIIEVLESIITNAIESLDETSGTIEISCGAATFKADSFPVPFLGEGRMDGEYVYVQITDTGHGISSQNLPLVFEPFYTTKFVGRGLGLALAVGIMQAHRGAVTVESIPGQGTTFRVLFKPALQPQLTTPSPELSVPEKEVQLSGNILFVDDEELVVALAERMLTTLNFSIQTASNGMDAINLVKDNPGHFCAVVMDVSMPDMDGFEAMKEIRKMEPSMPILLSSGYTEEHFNFDDDENGKPDDFLSKPFLLSDIRKSLERILS